MNPWQDFYQQTASRGPSRLLARALELAPESAGVAQAIDLGCGAGNETRQLLDAGWHVLAVDNEPGAIERTVANSSAANGGKLTTLLAGFEELPELPRASLIHAGLSLPFCRPDRFSYLWEQICTALVPGGVFVGHFFGVRHGWSGNERLSIHSQEGIRQLCEGMEIALLRESEVLIEKGGAPLNWHRFDLIVRKA